MDREKRSYNVFIYNNITNLKEKKNGNIQITLEIPKEKLPENFIGKYLKQMQYFGFVYFRGMLLSFSEWERTEDEKSL